MDEVSSDVRLVPAVRLTARPPKRLFRLVFESHDGRALGADSEEKHEPVSDIDTAVADSLKVLDLKWPIREADIRADVSQGLHRAAMSNLRQFPSDPSSVAEALVRHKCTAQATPEHR